MIGAPFSSFGMSAALVDGLAVNACSNSLCATFGVQVPAGEALQLVLAGLEQRRQHLVRALEELGRVVVGRIAAS